LETGLRVTTIDLDAGCCESELPGQFLLEFNGGYKTGHSLLTLQNYRPGELTRRRVKKAVTLGYQCRMFARGEFTDDIYAIHTSMEKRQGRPMSGAYLERQVYSSLPEYPCGRHSVRTLGVFLETTLVAYLFWYIVGDFAHASQLLGHGDHLENGVMYLLFLTAIGEAQENGATVFGYNLHKSGTDGLRFFKERLGFRPTDVEWVL
jgi:hypothetical protein